MLPIFTKYLLQYKRVCIPHVGTFELVQQSPRLDVADKVFSPPYFTTRFVNQDALPDHQFHFFAHSTDTAAETLKKELFLFGEDLKSHVQKNPFRWNGFGTLRYAAGGFEFEPQEIRLESLQGLRADKVIRPNVSHQVLVGDQAITSTDTARAVDRTGYKTPVYIIIGWIILLLALAAIAVILYFGKFQTQASGLRMHFAGYF